MVSNKYTQTDSYGVDVCMKIEDNAAVVVNAAEGTFTNRSIFLMRMVIAFIFYQ